MMYSESDEDPYCCDGHDSDLDKEYLPSDTEIDESDIFLKNSVTNSVIDINEGASTSQEVITENYEVDSSQEIGEQVGPANKTRKRKRDPKTWACNIRKKKYNSGEEYISSRKKLVHAKSVQNLKDCHNKCLFKCNNKITNTERQSIFSEYYSLSPETKKLFILTSTSQCELSRRRKGKNSKNSRRKITYHYFFNVNSVKIQVCKKFYLGTLSISQTPIYNAHSNKNSTSDTPKKSKQGKHTKHSIPESAKKLVKEHINSFPRINSHYCRARTQREYIESTLSIKKMYDLYLEFITEKQCEPVKESQYRYIFNNEFNIFFQTPKKDRCEICELNKLHTEENRLTDEEKTNYENHILEKNAAREERQKDRNGNVAVLTFDLQNVLTCPKAEISKFFYKSKLSVYNLTAHLSITKQVYCALWSEHLMGRKGNDLASALYKILEKVYQDHPQLEEIILWSDSCVPQNRNSIMSFAIGTFLKKHSLTKITMKYSTPGHSCVQEVDSVHSSIEKVLSKAEYYSPLSLLRLLLKVNRRLPYKIIQMRSEYFKNFHNLSSTLKYDNIPFSKVVMLEFTRSSYEINYKTSFTQENFLNGSLRSYRSRANAAQNIFDLEPEITKEVSELPLNKVTALQYMIKWMPKQDQNYYEVILKNYKIPNKSHPNRT